MSVGSSPSSTTSSFDHLLCLSHSVMVATITMPFLRSPGGIGNSKLPESGACPPRRTANPPESVFSQKVTKAPGSSPLTSKYSEPTQSSPRCGPGNGSNLPTIRGSLLGLANSQDG